MPIQAKQKSTKDSTTPCNSCRAAPYHRRQTSHFMNIRTDNNAVLGVTSERYGIVNNRDLIDVADHAFEFAGSK